MSTCCAFIDEVNGYVEKQQREIALMAKVDQHGKWLATSPGIGVYSAMILLSEISEVQKFLNAKALFGYAGLVAGWGSRPGKNRAGDFVRWLAATLLSDGSSGAYGGAMLPAVKSIPNRRASANIGAWRAWRSRKTVGSGIRDVERWCCVRRIDLCGGARNLGSARFRVLPFEEHAEGGEPNRWPENTLMVSLKRRGAIETRDCVLNTFRW